MLATLCIISVHYVLGMHVSIYSIPKKLYCSTLHITYCLAFDGLCQKAMPRLGFKTLYHAYGTSIGSTTANLS